MPTRRISFFAVLIVALCLPHGARAIDVKVKGNWGHSAPVPKDAEEAAQWRFAESCESISVEELQKQLQAGMRANAIDGYKRSALIYATRNPDARVIELLFKMGADPAYEVPGSVGCHGVSGPDTVLDEAVRYGGVEHVRLALGAGAQVSQDTLSPLSGKNDIRITKMIFDAGGRELLTTLEGQSAFLSIIRQGASIDDISFWLDSGASIHSSKLHEGGVLSAAADAQPLEVFELLLQRGATIGSADALLRRVAAYNTDVRVLRLLLTHGADVNSLNRWQETALMHAAAGNKNIEIIRALLQAGADVNAVDQGNETALIKAVRWRYPVEPKVVALLLDAEADVNVRDDDGKTAYDYARERGVQKIHLDGRLKPHAK